MNKLLLGGAAAIGLMAAAGAASAQGLSTGFVGGSYTNLSFDTPTPATGDPTITAEGSLILVQGTAAFDLSDRFEVQLDGEIGNLDQETTVTPSGGGSSSTSSSNSTIWGGTAHLFMDHENFKAGVFAGYEDLDDDQSTLGYGIEGRFSISDNVSIGGVIALGNYDLASGIPDVDLTAYRAEVSFFANDNLRIDASVVKTNAEWGPFTSADTTTWGVGGEWQMADNPFSVTAGYFMTSGDGINDVDSLSIGVRRTFGGTLKDRDRTSSPFQGLPFQFGGIGGILGAGASPFGVLAECISNEFEQAVESEETFCGATEDEFFDFLGSFDEDYLYEILCEALPEECYDL